MTRTNIVSRSIKLYKSEGLRGLFRTFLVLLKEICLEIIPNYIDCGFHKSFRSSDTVEFEQRRYNYFFHPYCATWRNERTVGVPIIWDLIKRYVEQKKNILEIGNVLSYYFKVSHDIIDKYEIMDGIINEDIVDFRPSKQYDLIVSIVTLEHVGWSESPREPDKIIRAFENLRTILSPGGQIVVVMGLGINPLFDASLEKNKIRFTKQSYFKHIKGHIWQEARWEDVKDLKYDSLVPTANAILIGSID